MKTIIPRKNEEYLAEAVQKFKSALRPVALTGAGISVNSGIADFRSPGGVWTIFSPDEYATIEVFREDPQKAWRLYRELGKCLVGKTPNKAHKVLADFEQRGLLKGLVTQNIDNLHQIAGNEAVLEIHGDHQHMQCIQCGNLVPATEKHYEDDTIPHCEVCDFPYKPNVVLFGETVRNIDRIERLLSGCDVLLVIGTSAKVYPAAGFPSMVKERGGKIFEFNLEPALALSSYGTGSSRADYFFEGDLSQTLPRFHEAVVGS